jgi:hypothetical protein
MAEAMSAEDINSLGLGGITRRSQNLRQHLKKRTQKDGGLTNQAQKLKRRRNVIQAGARFDLLRIIPKYVSVEKKNQHRTIPRKRIE